MSIITHETDYGKIEVYLNDDGLFEKFVTTFNEDKMEDDEGYSDIGEIFLELVKVAKQHEDFDVILTPNETNEVDGAMVYYHIRHIPSDIVFGISGYYSSYDGYEYHGNFTAKLGKKTIDVLLDVTEA